MINTAALSFDDHDHGKLWVGRRSLDQAISEINEQSELKIALMHHPVSWLSSAEQSNIKANLTKYFDCILSGHLHTNDIDQIAGLTGQTLHLQAGAAYQTRKWPNTALFASYALDSIIVTPVHYTDSPQEVWTIDTSIFPSELEYRKSYIIRGSSLAVAQPAKAEGTDAAEARDRIRADFEQDLFQAPSGKPLYAEPRLMTKPQESLPDDQAPAMPVALDEIVQSSKSFMIEARTEYGGSTLCKRLAFDFAASGKKAVRHDARNLPNYRAKLTNIFGSAASGSQADVVLILDHFDLERDEKLLREIDSLNTIGRIIAIATNRGAEGRRLSSPEGLARLIHQKCPEGLAGVA